MTTQSNPDQGDIRELEQLIEKRIKIASTEAESDDAVVQIAWLADGIDLWYSSNGKRGHIPAQARRYIISSITCLMDAAIKDSNRALYEKLKDTEWYCDEAFRDYIDAELAALTTKKES